MLSKEVRNIEVLGNFSEDSEKIELLGISWKLGQTKETQKSKAVGNITEYSILGCEQG